MDNCQDSRGRWHRLPLVGDVTNLFFIFGQWLVYPWCLIRNGLIEMPKQGLNEKYIMIKDP